MTHHHHALILVAKIAKIAAIGGGVFLAQAALNHGPQNGLVKPGTVLTAPVIAAKGAK